MSLKYLKGLRTKYANLITKELDNSKALSAEASAAISDNIIDVRRKVSAVIIKLKEYNSKLESTCEKLAIEIDSIESDSVKNKQLEEQEQYTDLMGTTLEATCELSELENELIKRQKEDNSKFEKLFEMQTKLMEKIAVQTDKKTGTVPKDSVKLPKLDIPSFQGDILKFQEFWDAFDACINKNYTLSPIEKFTYLRSKLEGDALEAISGLSLSSGNYDEAKKILDERFGDQQAMVNAHYVQLIDVPTARNSTLSLRTLADKIKTHLRSLRVLKQDTSQDIFITMITSKLPRDVLTHLEIQKGRNQKWTVDKLIESLDNYVAARESAERSNNPFDLNRASKNFNENKQSSTEHKQPNKLQHIASQPQENYQKSTTYKSTGEALLAKEATVKSTKKNCVYCNKDHWSDECREYSTVQQRREKVKGRCYNCFSKNHKVQECTVYKQCYYCSQKHNHHRSMCPKQFAHQEPSTLVLDKNEGTKTDKNEQSLLSPEETVLMQTATATVQQSGNSNLKKTANVLLDSGSYRSYISKKLAKELKLQLGKEEEIKLVTFGKVTTTVLKSPTALIDIPLRDGTILKLTVNVVPEITGEIQKLPINTKLLNNHLLKDLPLADKLPTGHESSKIDLLIGNDYYLDIVENIRITIQPGLYLMGSKLGWILTGRTSNELSTADCPKPSMLIIPTFGHDQLSRNDEYPPPDKSLPIKPDIEQFWNLESIGIKDSPTVSDDEIALKQFSETITKDDERYHVTWPWKENATELPDNYNLALGRLKSLNNKLKNNHDLLQQYNSIIQDQVNKDVIEKVDKEERSDSRKHYIPHHAVITPAKSTTKLRIVYDASSKSNKKDCSLNDCLYRGPVMIENLSGLLFRFRSKCIGILADIEKAFLQVGLQPKDRDVTRFLWYVDPSLADTSPENIQIYRFTRIPFGVISSPFLLSATIDHHLSNEGTTTAETIRQNIYVDNVILGANNIQEAKELYNDSKDIFERASMNLREWISNSDELMKHVNTEDKMKETTTVVKTLGMIWDLEKDTLATSHVKLSQSDTKRGILQSVSSIFDPLGLITPITLSAKLLVQDLWKEGKDWDQEISTEQQLHWKKIKEQLELVESIALPRFIGTTENSAKYKLLCFTDASKKAYAATVYLLIQTQSSTKVNLVFSKSRLAPTKELTIPRLELLGVLIGIRCLKFVETELKLCIDERILWTDSQCVLKWLNSNNQFSVFVENRLKEIKSFETTFKYVSTTDNPADLPTRGVSVQELKHNELWWNGPKWLTLPQDMWPNWQTNDITPTVTEAVNSEVKTTSRTFYEAGLLTKQATQQANICNLNMYAEERFSSISKLLRVTVLVLRFIKKLKRRNSNTGAITSQELNNARNLWEINVQKKAYSDVLADIQHNTRNNLAIQLGLKMDCDGLLKCYGRLNNSNFSKMAKTPILLPKSEYFTKLVIEAAHKTVMHSGVSHTLAQTRQRYWIPHGRSTVKRIIKKCVTCRRWEGGPYKMPEMPPLPTERVTRSPPFSETGLDYLGPLYIKDETSSEKKVWICLFTCLAVRAIHLELVQELSAEQFLLCLRRFIALYGAPKQIFSDNASQFKLAKETIDKAWMDVQSDPDVQSYLANQNIEWKFITTNAPWMGGFYERLVGLVKRALRKTLGKGKLTYDQLATVITEITAVLNTRPLVYLSDDINEKQVLSPQCFLRMNMDIKPGTPEWKHEQDPDFTPVKSSADVLLQTWKDSQLQLNHFWKVWADDYLLSLRERHRKPHLKSPRVVSTETISVGDIVLLHESLPRGSWKPAIVQSLIRSKDGQIRSAEVMLPSKRVVIRPLNLMYPLECSKDEIEKNTANSPSKEALPPMYSSSNTREARPQRQAAKKARKLVETLKPYL